MENKKELALVPSKYFNFTKIALGIKTGTPIEEWLRIGEVLKKTNMATQWWIGDWLNFGEREYGEKYSQAETTDYKYTTLRQFAWVASKIPLYARTYNLSFRHYLEVAKLEEKEQKKWLKKAETEDWSAQELRRQLKTSVALEASQPRGNGKVHLIEGDILKVKIPEVDIVITDPPYNVTENEWDKIGTPQEFMKWTGEWLKRIKWNKHLFVFCSSQYISDFEFLLKKLEFPIKSRIVWVHKNMSLGRVVQDRFINCYDMIFHCGKTDLNFPPDWTSERFDIKEYANPQSNFKDIKLHPTQKPYELIKELIKVSAKEGDIILDCFAGSGTTGLAAKELGHECYLIERDKQFIDIIKKRLKI